MKHFHQPHKQIQHVLSPLESISRFSWLRPVLNRAYLVFAKKKGGGEGRIFLVIKKNDDNTS